MDVRQRAAVAWRAWWWAWLRAWFGSVRQRAHSGPAQRALPASAAAAGSARRWPASAEAGFAAVGQVSVDRLAAEAAAPSRSAPPAAGAPVPRVRPDAAAIG